MAISEERIFPSQYFLYTFLGLSVIAMVMSFHVMNGWVMWFFPAYLYLWSKGLQNKNRGIRVRG